MINNFNLYRLLQFVSQFFATFDTKLLSVNYTTLPIPLQISCLETENIC